MEKSGLMLEWLRESDLLVLVTNQIMSCKGEEGIKDCASISTSCNWTESCHSLIWKLLDQIWSWKCSV